ncbi:hypothetical protein HPB49_003138 [Dermacentor silvarum]|uniref:Uncharacterized protein n=1 Tax=Dermacentor silvarum TaxID=543639 RepID=A0ACB8C712_DERSI|nr:hypothetical protein HPB49_003138 [Dermacentor silvarum]
MPNIGDKIVCKLAPSDLDVVHRVVTVKAGAKNVLARFGSRSKKAEFVSKARKVKLCLEDIGLSGAANSPVYINDQLTPENKALSLKKGEQLEILMDRQMSNQSQTDYGEQGVPHHLRS